MENTHQSTEARLSLGQKILTYVAMLAGSALLGVAGVWLIVRHVETQSNEPVHMVRVGVLERNVSLEDIYDGFRASLAENGFTQGRNIFFSKKNSFGDAALLKKYAQDFATRKFDIILALGGESATVAKEATASTSIPVLFYTSEDPVALGLIASMASSENNLVGIVAQNYFHREVEILRKLIPDLATVGVVHDGTDQAGETFLRQLQESASDLGLTIVASVVQTETDIAPALDSLKARGAQIVYRTPSAKTIALAPLMATEALQRNLGLFSHSPGVTAQGGLVLHSVDYTVVGKQLAAMANTLLTANPTPLSSTFPEKEYLTINTKTAQTLGITVPQDVLQSANVVY